MSAIIPIVISKKGGAGSGNWGHTGRPGMVGGSGGRGGPGFVPAGDVGVGHGEEAANDFLNAALSDTAAPKGEDWKMASQAEREVAKKAIISELMERTGLPEEDINNVIKQWAHTSNDSDMRALSLQEAAAEELGLEMSEWQQGLLDNPIFQEGSYIRKNFPEKTNPILPRDQERAIIRAMYEHTQEELAKAGYKPDDTISLARGITYDSDSGYAEGGKTIYQGNTMESWSASTGVAETFATNEGNYDDWGVVISMDVPVRNIIGTARTGFGCLSEGEFVIAGNIPKQLANVWETFKPYTEMTSGEQAVIWGTAGTEEQYTAGLTEEEWANV